VKTDIANLKAEDIDWRNQTIYLQAFHRTPSDIAAAIQVNNGIPQDAIKPRFDALFVANLL
jgi:hypothetical protein